MSNISDFEEINGRYVAFGGNPKGGKISGKGKIRTGKLDFDDVYFVKELKFNLFSVSQISAQTKKHDDKTNREANGKSPVEWSIGYKNLSAELEDFSDNSINEVNATDSPVPVVGQILTNSTNTFSAAEEITYFDDEEDVDTEADFTNLETTITVSPIPTTRVHKDHPVTQIIGDLSLATQTRSMTMVAKDQGGLSQINNDDFHTYLCNAFEKLMKDKFQMSSMGELTFFWGLQVKQKPDGIFISQDKYVAKILRKYGLTNRKSASTPIDTEKPLLKDPDGEDVDVHTYISMIGSLMYLTSSRPYIMFAVYTCAHFQVTPKVSYLHAVKRIFRYLKGKTHLGLWYPKDSPFNLVLIHVSRKFSEVLVIQYNRALYKVTGISLS
uniref:Reverse transcriptase Ty1/copia-type domain-containing protein n=1 Tax=Tanacetum cinerariifolium TaxID=118510 RepID=A0A6L2LSI9_TANCI|nr:hypothetical protein [Tanacetum cinerariifolium]